MSQLRLIAVKGKFYLQLRELFLRSMGNSTESLEEFLLDLWEQNRGAISRTLMACEADLSLRQDLKQDLYLALHQSLQRIKGAANPRAYLFRIMHNVTVDHIIKAQKHKYEPLNEDVNQEPTQTTPSQQLFEQQQSQQLMRAIRQLSPANKQVILLLMEDIDAVEIGEILQISHGAVRVRINRAKVELKELMQNDR